MVVSGAAAIFGEVAVVGLVWRLVELTDWEGSIELGTVGVEVLGAWILDGVAEVGLVGRSEEAFDTERLDELRVMGVGDGLIKVVMSMYSTSSTVGDGGGKNLFRLLEDGGSVVDNSLVASRAGVVGRFATRLAFGDREIDGIFVLHGVLVPL